MKATYDIKLSLMTSVTVDMENPLEPDTPGIQRIKLLAVNKAADAADLLICEENVTSIKLHSYCTDEAEKTVNSEIINLERPECTEAISESLNNLQALKASRYIPFASPCPCSTESALKKCVLKAIDNLKEAMHYARLLRYL